MYNYIYNIYNYLWQYTEKMKSQIIFKFYLVDELMYRLIVINLWLPCDY